MDDGAHETYLIPCLDPHFPLSPPQRLFPEKLSRCQWLPALSEAVVKRPCVRLPLATVTTTVISILAVFNLVSANSIEIEIQTVHVCVFMCPYYTPHSAISGRVTPHGCHTKLQSTLSSGCLSVKCFCFFFFIPPQCFVETHVTECSSNNTNNSSEQGLEGDLSYLPVSAGFVTHRK